LHKIFYAETNARQGNPLGDTRKCKVSIKMTFKKRGLKIWSELIRIMKKKNDQSLSTTQF
jgi:hypothetical protein